MLPAVQAAITRAWVSGGWVRGALTPISLIYGALTGLQRAAYRAGLLQSSALPVPVIGFSSCACAPICNDHSIRPGASDPIIAIIGIGESPAAQGNCAS